MATIDLCPETTTWLWAGSTACPADNDESVESPRISFSHSDGEGQTSPPRLDGALLLGSPASDFNFCVAAGVGHYDPPASAAELFFDGKLLPLAATPATQIDPFSATPRWVFPPPVTEQSSPPRRPPPPLYAPECATEAGERLKEILARREDDDGGERNNHAAVPARPSFWRFGRSKSLKVAESAAAASHKSGLLRSFQLLPRSKSTGSNPNNPALFSTASNSKLQRQPSLNGGKKARPAPSAGRKPSSPSPKALARSVSCTATFYHNPPSTSSTQAPAHLMSSYYYSSRSSSSSAAAVKIRPVLNIPTPYVLPRTGSSSSSSAAAVKIRPVLNIPTPYVLPRTGSSGGGSGLSGIGFLLCNWKKRPQEL